MRAAVRGPGARALLGLLCLLSALGAGVAHASLPDIAGFGVRGPALAGTGAAYGQGFEATYQNPAGLLGAPRSLSAGVVYGGHGLRLDGTSLAVEDTAGLLLGASLPLPLGGVMRERLALGLGLYLPFGVVNRARDPLPDVPRPALVGNRTQVVSVLLGAAVRLPQGFTIGGGVLALAALVGTILIEPDSVGRITAASQEQVTLDYAPVLGVRWQRGRLSLGTTLRGRSQSSYRLVVTTNLKGQIPIGLPEIIFAGVAQYDPLQVASEAALRLGPALLIGGLTYKRWSAYSQPVEAATADSPPLPEPGFHDTVVPRLAVEVTPPLLPSRGALALRAGYFFEWSPAPLQGAADEATRALLDAHRHVVSAGVGYQAPWRVPLRLDLYFQWHQLQGSARLQGGFALGGAALGVAL